MSNDNNSGNGGIGFFGLLTILFIGLKLAGHITWSWWTVLAPTLVPLGLVLVFIFILFVLYLFEG